MQRPTHLSFGKNLEDIVVQVVGASRTSIALTRTMLSMCGLRNVKAFEDPIQALNHMIGYNVDLILIEAECKPISGLKLVKVMRHYLSEPICFLPVVLLTNQPTQSYVSQAARMGAQLVLARPHSTTELRSRLQWVLRDKRKLLLKSDTWVIDGAHDMLQNTAQNRLLPVLMSQLGLAPDSPAAKARAAQSLIDNILGQPQTPRAVA